MLKSDCIYFPLDRPCVYHKKIGIHCNDCKYYSPVKGKDSLVQEIVIIKLDAMGDVLRTTFLLPGLKEKYRTAKFTWIVASESVALLIGNPYIDRILPFDKDIFQKVLTNRFDIAINLDLSPNSLTLASIISAKKKIGFWLDNNRRIKFSNVFAYKWLLMSAFDNIKRDNKMSYQYWMSKIVGIPRHDYEIMVPLQKSSIKKAELFAKKHKIFKKTVIGINIGAGKRWKLKRWTTQGYKELIKALSKIDVKVLLYGGPSETELMSYLTNFGKGYVTNTGSDNSIEDFFALLNLSDIIITSDTLALHAALGLGKKVVALFGPTSASEIEMYQRGIKIIPNLQCICCYKTECNIKPNCMESIKVEDILDAVMILMKKK